MRPVGKKGSGGGPRAGKKTGGKGKFGGSGKRKQDGPKRKGQGEGFKKASFNPKDLFEVQEADAEDDFEKYLVSGFLLVFPAINCALMYYWID